MRVFIWLFVVIFYLLKQQTSRIKFPIQNLVGSTRVLVVPIRLALPATTVISSTLGCSDIQGAIRRLRVWQSAIFQGFLLTPANASKLWRLTMLKLAPSSKGLNESRPEPQGCLRPLSTSVHTCGNLLQRPNAATRADTLQTRMIVSGLYFGLFASGSQTKTFSAKKAFKDISSDARDMRIRKKRRYPGD